jgi:hypothetical protein
MMKRSAQREIENVMWGGSGAEAAALCAAIEACEFDIFNYPFLTEGEAGVVWEKFKNSIC